MAKYTLKILIGLFPYVLVIPFVTMALVDSVKTFYLLFLFCFFMVLHQEFLIYYQTDIATVEILN